MSIQVLGSNVKDDIESNAAFVDGDILYCEPGDGFCGSRMFECRILNYPFIVDSPFDQAIDLTNIPDFGSNQYALKIIPGVKYYVEDVTEFKYNDTYIINHIADPQMKRYFEAWITYYPTSAYAMTPVTSDDNTLQTLTKIEIKPLIYPELVNSFPVVVGSWLYSDNYEGLKVRDSGTYVTVYTYLGGDGGGYLFEWNDTTEQYDLAITFTGYPVYGFAAFDEYSSQGPNPCKAALVYDNDGSRVKYYIKDPDGTYLWEETGDYDWPGGARPIQINGYILSGGNRYGGIYYNWDTREQLYSTGSDPDYSQFVPQATFGYTSSCETVYGYDNGYVSTLGGPLHKQIIRSQWSGYDSYALAINGLEEDDDNAVWMTEGIFLKSPIGTVFKTDQNQWSGMPDMDLTISATIDGWPSYSQGYIIDSFMVNCSSNVYLILEDEVINLYPYDFATHKKYDGRFYPVKYPYFMTYEDSNIKVVKVITTHYDEVLPAVVTLKCVTPSDITTTTNFEIPDAPVGTTTKLLLSDDDITYYKWSGSSWVAETDINNGNDKATFVAGCLSGYVFPAASTEAYIKIQMSSTSRDETPSYDFSEIKLSLTTISVQSNAYMADDSKLKVEFISDTETKITSLLGQNVIMSYQLCLMAPPYNVEYED